MNRKTRKLLFIRKKNHKREYGMKGDEIITFFGVPPLTIDELLDKGYRISAGLKKVK